MRLGPLPLAVPIGDEEPDASPRGVLVATHQVVFGLEYVQGVQLEQHPFAGLPLAHRVWEAVEALPDRYSLA
jgi:hypothetical protein